MLSNKAYRAIVYIFCQLVIPFCSFAQFHTVHTETTNTTALKLSFYSGAEGYVAFDSFIGFTSDSGHTFTQRTITNNVNYNGYSVNLTFGFAINGVHGFDRNKLVVYGNYGGVPAILYSSDQGATFKLVYQNQFDPTKFNSGITDMIFPAGDGIGYAVDNDRIFKTTDGGVTWQVSDIEAGNGFTGLTALDDNQVFAFGATTKLFKTANGGSSWSAVSLPPGSLQYAGFLTANKGWLSTSDGKLFETLNGGSSWAQQNALDNDDVAFTKFSFVNDSTGYAINSQYNVYKTSNSGKIWERLPYNDNATHKGYLLRDLQLSGTQLWASGDHGYIVLSPNAAASPTIPKALFAIDTTGVSVSEKVKLVNQSRTGYTYQWLLNGKAISSSYNTSYTRDIFHLTDTLKLVETNKGYADTLTQYAQFNPPVIVNSFTPASGPAGTTVTITGTNFNNATQVEFGGQPATSFTQVSNTTVTAIVGTGASGKVTVVNAWGAGSKDGFTFVPPPVISSFSPSTAKAGTTIVINGINFSGVTAVNFGGSQAASFKVISATQISAVLGKGSSGNITISGPGGTGNISGFEDIPVITAFTPASGTAGTILHITGTGLDGVTGVTVAGVNARSFTVDSASSVTAVVQESNPGTTNVVVTAPGGSSSLAAFTYYHRPVISSFTPASGPAGTVVTINGNYFGTTGNQVFFGAVAGQVLTGSTTKLTVKVPAGATYAPISVITHQLNGYAINPFVTTFSGGGSIVASTFSAEQVVSTKGGRFAVVADLDNDGKPDILMQNNDNNAFIALRNTGSAGNPSFVRSDVNTYKVGDAYYVLADVDGDGKPDIVAQGPGGASLAVSLNTSVPGTISFSAAITVTAPNLNIGNSNFGVMDMDGDGKPDIINGNTLLLNQSEPGHPRFSAPISLPGNSNNNIIIADFNGDGKPDLLVNDANQNVYALINECTPGYVLFGQSGTLGFDVRSTIATGDLDGDGKIDIIASDGNGPNRMYVFKNTSSGGGISFTKVGDYQTGSGVNNITISDLDGDGKVDVTVVSANDNKSSVYKNLSNSGTITLGTPVDYVEQHGIGSLSACDIDGDGKTDLVYTDNNTNVITMLNQATATPYISTFTPSNGVSGTSVQINGTNFNNVTAVKFGGIVAASFKINSDTSITAVVGNGSSGNVSVSNSFGTATLAGFVFGQPVVINSFSPLSGAAGTTVTIKGNHFDPAAANNIVYFGAARAQVTSATATQLTAIAPAGATFSPLSVTTNQTTAFAPTAFDLTFTGGDQEFDVRSFSARYVIKGGQKAIVGDVDGDGKLDLVYEDILDHLVVALNQGISDSVAFAPTATIGDGTYIQHMYLYDMDGDGKQDLVCVYTSDPNNPNLSSNHISILKNTSTPGNVSFAAPVILIDPDTKAAFNGIGDIAVGDADGDGLPDIAYYNYAAQEFVLLISQTKNSNFVFRRQLDIPVGSYTTGVALRDIDGDGKPDLIGTGGASPVLSVFKNTGKPGNVSFAAGQSFSLTGMPQGLIVEDINGDGKPDVIVTNSALDGSVYTFINNSTIGNISFNTGSTVKQGAMASGGFVTDLNGDGKADLMLNLEDPSGLYLLYNNGIYDPTYSYLLPGLGGTSTTGDIDQDGKPDIIQSYYDASQFSSFITILRNKTKKLLTLPDKNFTVEFTGSTCNGSDNGSISIRALTKLPYTATITGPGYSLAKTFTDSLTVSPLKPGRYSACITVSGYPDFEQCFSDSLSQPANLSVYTIVDHTTNSVTVQLNGGTNYSVTLNGTIYQTNQKSITLSLAKGNNKLIVATDRYCQGTYALRIVNGNSMDVYPNPFTGKLQVDAGDSQASNATVEVFNLYGKKVYTGNVLNDFGKLNLDLTGLNADTYILKVTMADTQSVYKIWKK